MEKKAAPVKKEPEQKAPEGKKQKKGKEKEPKTLKQEIMSWIWTILSALVLALALRALVAEPVKVDGTSMTNTLADGEIVLVSKLDYVFGDLKRNDIVICRYPNRMNGSLHLGAAVSLDYYTLFVKRLVALPGDSVEIKGGHLYVNGELVPDPEKQGSVPRDYELRVLGEDEYFVIGDNRRTSHDSRASSETDLINDVINKVNDPPQYVGPISRSAIMGKVKCVLYPFSRIRGVE